MKTRKQLRDFTKWLISNDMSINSSTIDYEVVETYLEDIGHTYED